MNKKGPKEGVSPEVVDLAEYRERKETSGKNPEEASGKAPEKPPVKIQEGTYTIKRVQALLEGGRYPSVDNYAHKGNRFMVMGLPKGSSLNTMTSLRETIKRKQPYAIITEMMGGEEGVVEVAPIKVSMLIGEIPGNDWIISAYNQVVADYAGVKYKDAAKAIMLAPASRYHDDPDFAEHIINIGLGLGDEEINEVWSEIIARQGNEEENGREKNNAIANFNKMLQTANDINWHLFREVLKEAEESKIKDKLFMVVCRMEYAQIFSPEFRPSRAYSIETLVDIIEEIKEIRLLRIKREEEETGIEGYEAENPEKEFHKEWEFREDQLRKDPNNQVAKQALKNLLLPRYRKFLRRGRFEKALKLAQSMQKHRIGCAEELIRRANALIESKKK